MTKVFDFKEKINDQDLLECAKAIKNGKLVIFPTETVYGIGADATNENACINIFIAKGRAQDNPLIVHIADFEDLEKIIEEPSKLEKQLMDAFMPGPFTLILKKKPIIPNTVSANLNTVGIRMPENKIAHDLIKLSHTVIAAPSANKSGKPSGTNINDIFDEFNNKVDYIIDSGETKIGLESTVVKVIDGIPTILRPGKITPEDIIRICGKVKVSDNLFKPATGIVESPGMKYRHYAPTTKCILVFSPDNEKIITEIKNNLTNKTCVIGSSTNKKHFKCDYIDYGNSLEEISHNIFTLLRQADKLNDDLIIIEGVKKEGLGIAIMNRLIRTCEYNYIEVR